MLKPQIFKANDIRGVVGAEWDAEGARALGAAFARAFDLDGHTFVLSRDMRQTGPALAKAFIQGATEAGASVVDVGLASTDGLWFASGFLRLPGVQFTASHNPGQYNGVKFCQADAAPITPALMAKIREFAGQDLPPAKTPGTVSHRDILDDYAAHLRGLVDLSGVHGLKIVVDAGNGMAGLTTPAILGPLDAEITGLYLDLDGSFPNHPPNPLEPENLVDAQRAVREAGADIGLVFDGDADRCFIIDERGEVVSPSVITALVARDVLAREPGAAIVVNTITSRVVADTVAAAGGRLIVSKVGHTYIKAHMAAENAVFGGEHSAHYYFRDFWGADTGMLAALTVIGLMTRAGESRLRREKSELVRSSELIEGPRESISALVAELPRYAASGELNTTVADPRAVMDEVAVAFPEGEVSHPDGLFITGDGWWLSVRESNTEPLLRLNVEAAEDETMAALRDRALAVIRKDQA